MSGFLNTLNGLGASLVLRLYQFLSRDWTVGLARVIGGVTAVILLDLTFISLGWEAVFIPLFVVLTLLWWYIILAGKAAGGTMGAIFNVAKLPGLAGDFKVVADSIQKFGLRGYLVFLGLTGWAIAINPGKRPLFFLGILIMGLAVYMITQVMDRAKWLRTTLDWFLIMPMFVECIVGAIWFIDPNTYRVIVDGWAALLFSFRGSLNRVFGLSVGILGHPFWGPALIIGVIAMIVLGRFIKKLNLGAAAVAGTSGGSAKSSRGGALGGILKALFAIAIVFAFIILASWAGGSDVFVKSASVSPVNVAGITVPHLDLSGISFFSWFILFFVASFMVGIIWMNIKGWKHTGRGFFHGGWIGLIAACGLMFFGGFADNVVGYREPKPRLEQTSLSAPSTATTVTFSAYPRKVTPTYVVVDSGTVITIVSRKAMGMYANLEKPMGYGRGWAHPKLPNKSLSAPLAQDHFPGAKDVKLWSPILILMEPGVEDDRVVGVEIVPGRSYLVTKTGALYTAVQSWSTSHQGWWEFVLSFSQPPRHIEPVATLEEGDSIPVALFSLV